MVSQYKFIAEIYTNISSFPFSQNDASFISVIKSLWKINEEVIEDMFPSFLDKESMQYLIEVSDFVCGVNDFIIKA